MLIIILNVLTIILYTVHTCLLDQKIYIIKNGNTTCTKAIIATMPILLETIKASAHTCFVFKSLGFNSLRFISLQFSYTCLKFISSNKLSKCSSVFKITSKLATIWSTQLKCGLDTHSETKVKTNIVKNSRNLFKRDPKHLWYCDAKELEQSSGSQDKEAVSSGHGPQPDIKAK